MPLETREQSPDPFDAALNVESQLHDRGYNEGLKDGAQAGLIEGRGLGLQKGFEKFLESGRCGGKALVWANRLSTAPSQTASNIENQTLPPLPNNTRLEKNINSLYTLMDPKMLSIDNSDAAVQDFDDRLKKAEGKVRIIERVVAGSNRS